MKNYLLLALYVIFSVSSLAQVKTIKVKKLSFVPAAFPGGKEGIKKYLDKQIGSNIQRRLMNGERVEFTAEVEINEMGSVDKVTLLRGSARPFIDSIFIRALEKMPAWIPARDQKGMECKDKQLVSFEPGWFSFQNGIRAKPNRCYASKEDLASTTKIVGMIEDQSYDDSTKTGVVLCRLILADKREYRDIKALVVIQECNWNTGSTYGQIIPGCYNCDMSVLTEKPERFNDVKWEKYQNSGYKKFYLVDDRHSVINAVSH